MMNFLESFLYLLNEYFKVFYKKGDFSKHVFARFATRESYISQKTKLLKPAIFTPAKNKTLSVYDVLSLSISEIKSIGFKKVVRNGKVIKHIYGYAKTSGTHFTRNNLIISYNNIPKRHANIIGWPDKDTDKDKRKDIALSLLQNSEHHVF